MNFPENKTATLPTYKRLLKDIRSLPDGESAIAMLPHLYTFDVMSGATRPAKTGEMLAGLGWDGFAVLERLLFELRKLADDDDCWEAYLEMPGRYPGATPVDGEYAAMTKEEWLSGILKSNEGDLSIAETLSRVLSGQSVESAKASTKSLVRGFIHQGAELFDPALREARRLLMKQRIDAVGSSSAAVESTPRRRRISGI